MIFGIDIVFIHVKNPEKMSQWYREVLGLEVGFKMDDMSWLEFHFNDDRSPTRFALERSSGESQSIMISFRVHNLEATIQEIESRGAEFLGEDKIKAEGPSLFATLEDPEGNLIQLSQRIEN
jgi:predicted enzyme related to lactoylglutathione lyase